LGKSVFLVRYAFCRPSGRFFCFPPGLREAGFCDAGTVWRAQGDSSAALQWVPERTGCLQCPISPEAGHKGLALRHGWIFTVLSVENIFDCYQYLGVDSLFGMAFANRRWVGEIVDCSIFHSKKQAISMA